MAELADSVPHRFIDRTRAFTPVNMHTHEGLAEFRKPAELTAT
jgi:hypothetical protein